MAIPRWAALYHIRLKKVEWDSLIKVAFEAESPLLDETNSEENCREPNRKWHNFITAIPAFTGNAIRLEDNMQTRPILTMDISCEAEDHNDLLRLFDFARIDKIVGAIIEDYLTPFQITIEEFWAYDNAKSVLELGSEGGNNT